MVFRSGGKRWRPFVSRGPAKTNERSAKEVKEMEEKDMEELEEQEKGKKKTVDEKLPYCTTAPSAEHARASDDDEPCDDGREGDIDQD
jgi:hypothetical protein